VSVTQFVDLLPRPRFYRVVCYPGALKATNNRGLQPAMDHLIENEGKTVPDPSSVSSAEVSIQPFGDPMDEDEDLEALRAVYGTGGSGQAEAEAKVCDLLPGVAFQI